MTAEQNLTDKTKEVKLNTEHKIPQTGRVKQETLNTETTQAHTKPIETPGTKETQGDRNKFRNQTKNQTETKYHLKGRKQKTLDPKHLGLESHLLILKNENVTLKIKSNVLCFDALICTTGENGLTLISRCDA